MCNITKTKWVDSQKGMLVNDHLAVLEKFRFCLSFFSKLVICAHGNND